MHQSTKTKFGSAESSIIQKIVSSLLKNTVLKGKLKHNKFLRKTSEYIFILLRRYYSRNLKIPVIKTVSLGRREFKILLMPSGGLVEQTIYSFDHWEPEISKLIQKNSDKEGIFVDVGANIGYHSLYASFFFKKVVAFEPLPSVFNQFKQSIKLNNFTNIVAHNLACSNKEGKSLIYYGEDLGGSSLNNSLTKKGSSQKDCSLEVTTVTLDCFLKDAKSRISLIKMDVEGHEPLVIEGMKKIIKNHRPIIMTEFFPTGLNKIKKGQDLEFLENLSKDYEIIDIEKNKKTLDFKKYVKKSEHKPEENFISNLLLVPKKT